MNNWLLDEEGKIVVPVGATVKLDTRIFERLSTLEVNLVELAEFLHEGMNLLNTRIDLLSSEVETIKESKL